MPQDRQMVALRNFDGFGGHFQRKSMFRPLSTFAFSFLISSNNLTEAFSLRLHLSYRCITTLLLFSTRIMKATTDLTL